ncbi:MAG TPA: S8 family serine peptidase [Steroidobacteraceae bacterium]|nr:S8 family serine peptidase [Steroidobacteraceae bacterium]
MSAQRLGVAAVALLAVVAASATAPPRQVLKHPAAPAGRAPLMAFGGRSAAQFASGIGGKLDAALADLTRHAYRIRPDHELEDLHSLSPAARFMQHGAGAEPLVAVDAVTRGDPQALRDALVSLGLEHPAVFRNDVGGWLPVSAIDAAAARAEVTSVRAALSRAHAAVATQGDFAQDTFGTRAALALNGAGVTVGVLSVSYNCYAVYAANQMNTVGGVPDPPPGGPTGYAFNTFTADATMDVSTGALPSGVNVLEEAGGGGSGCITQFGYPLQLPFTDEGRAMLQIVHAVAPAAALAFYSAVNSEADFANGIQALANAGAKVIADDVGYFDEPFFQDGLLAQAIDTVEGQGVAYFSAAGNDGNLAYDNTTPRFNAGSGPNGGETMLNLDASGKTMAPALMVKVPVLFPGEFIAVVLEWDQPFLTGAYPGNAGSDTGATSQLELCASVPSGTGVDIYNYNLKTSTCTGLNAKGTDPVQILIIANPANAPGNSTAATISLSVGLANGSPVPGRIKLAWEDDGAGSTFVNFAPTTNGTIQGHPAAAGAAAVGAAFFPETPLCGVTPAILEPYSSFGGDPILFDASGNRLAAPVFRQKPDFVGPDGVNTTFFGFTLASATPPIQDNSTVAECANDGSYPNYFGTSAAAPHAAGLAALMLQANPAVTPTDIYQAISFTAAPMVNPSPDFTTGHGFIQAGGALAWPNMSVTPATITLGQSATLSWNAASVNTCTATAGFSTNAISGSMNVTPNAAGQVTYTMKCTNAAGTATESATLTVNAVTPLSVSTTSLPSGQVGAAYSAALAATGGTTPYTWALTSGTLPSGLALASSGAITGTPAASASNVALTFKVTDSGNPAQSITENLSLTIAPASSSGGHGGGGALGELTLLALAGLGLARALRARRRAA